MRRLHGRSSRLLEIFDTFSSHNQSNDSDLAGLPTRSQGNACLAIYRPWRFSTSSALGLSAPCFKVLHMTNVRLMRSLKFPRIPDMVSTIVNNIGHAFHPLGRLSSFRGACLLLSEERNSPIAGRVLLRPISHVEHVQLGSMVF